MSGQEELIASRMMNRFGPKVKIEQRIAPIYKKKPTRRVTFKDFNIYNYESDDEDDEPEIETGTENDPERPGYYTILNNLRIIKKEEKESNRVRILAYKERNKHNKEILDERNRILKLIDQPDKFSSRMKSLLEKIETLEEKGRIDYEIRRVSDLERFERKKKNLDQYTLFTGEVVETYPDEEDYPIKSDILSAYVIRELSSILLRHR